jgi:RNA polymerase sigma factor (sigma-70 family)
MKITAITRYKHAGLYALLNRIGWTQLELSRRANLTIRTVNDIINLVRRPTGEQADAIQSAIGEAGEYLDVLAEWPESFTGLKHGYKHEQTADVEMENILGCSEALRLQYEEPVEDSWLDTAIDEILGTLTEREALVLRERFYYKKTLDKIAEMIGTQRERVRQIEAVALRKLRHPKRISILSKAGSISAETLEKYISRIK